MLENKNAVKSAIRPSFFALCLLLPWASPGLFFYTGRTGIKSERFPQPKTHVKHASHTFGWSGLRIFARTAGICTYLSTSRARRVTEDAGGKRRLERRSQELTCWAETPCSADGMEGSWRKHSFVVLIPKIAPDYFSQSTISCSQWPAPYQSWTHFFS